MQSHMLTQVGFVLLPYGPGLVSWLDLRASSPICLGACTKYASVRILYGTSKEDTTAVLLTKGH